MGRPGRTMGGCAGRIGWRMEIGLVGLLLGSQVIGGTGVVFLGGMITAWLRGRILVFSFLLASLLQPFFQYHVALEKDF